MEANNMSMFSRCDNSVNNDPFEEIFALNLGDFISEHLISEDLAKKIKRKIKSEPETIKKQLQELISIYSINNTLSMLGFEGNSDYILYNTIAKAIAQMTDVRACHIFLAKKFMRGKIQNDLFLAGSSCSICQTNYKYDYGYNFSDDKSPVESFKSGKILRRSVTDSRFNYDFLAENKENLKSIEIYPIRNNMIQVGVLIIEKDTTDIVPKNYESLILSTVELCTISLQVQIMTEEALIIIKEPNPQLSILKHLRAELTVMIGDLGDAQQKFVEALAQAVDTKSANQSNHSKETAKLAKNIADAFGLNEKTKDLIYYAALLQNIGKIILSEKLFNKKEALTEEELAQLNNTPNVGVSILMKINFLSEVVPYIHYYKERWDGTGVPERLKGYSIPFGSRIIAVADAYCALREVRTFRDGLSDEETLKILSDESGTKWDPVVVEKLKEIDRT